MTEQPAAHRSDCASETQSKPPKESVEFLTEMERKKPASAGVSARFEPCAISPCVHWQR